MTTLQIFDVEHGACALLTCANGARVMIDCGHQDAMPWYPGTHLSNVGVNHLDQLVVMNYDQDHISGYINLADRVRIARILRNTSVTPAMLYKLKSEDGVVSTAMVRLIHDLSATFGPPGSASPPQLPGVAWNVWWNSYPSFDDENNLSVVLHLTVHGTSFLFPGDLEAAGWRALLSAEPGLAAAARGLHVLIAAHHGRESGICPELFDVHGARPQIVVISDDFHQYDTQDTSDFYRSKCTGIRGFRGQSARYVLSARSDGAITFQWNERGCLAT